MIEATRNNGRIFQPTRIISFPPEASWRRFVNWFFVSLFTMLPLAVADVHNSRGASKASVEQITKSLSRGSQRSPDFA